MRKNQLTSSYRRAGDWFLVDLKLKSLAQIYNSFDPSPFHERDLDDDAAEYIVEAMMELTGHNQVKLVIHEKEASSEVERTQLADAIHNYFSYRARAVRLELKEKLRFGRSSLLIGLVFLAVCFEIRALMPSDTGMFLDIAREGLMIIGWVMLWRPLEIFLYGWWPLLGNIRLYERLQSIPVDFQLQ